MIYYFTGTGNSRFVATRLAELTMDSLWAIGKCDTSLEVPLGESIGFVFPIYAWGVAPVMVDFINSFPESFWEEIKQRDLPVWCVMTCGDEVGLAPEMFSKLMASHGLEVRSMWSVIMPNTYVLLPGFDVDPKEVADRKLSEAEPRICEIADGISNMVKKVNVVRGSLPWLKTKLVYPYFKKHGIDAYKWRHTNACVSCGICAKACPIGNIIMLPDGPHWLFKCCSCLACYHSCPRNAVQYGDRTLKKGQYYLPAPVNETSDDEIDKTEGSDGDDAGGGDKSECLERMPDNLLDGIGLGIETVFEP